MNAKLPVNLMLVEDERVVAFDLKRQLSGFGYHVGSVVSSGEQAIRRVEEAKPDLVLMDIHLEGRMDGIEAAAEIRSRHRIPVVFLTAYAEEDTLGRALDSRPFGYLVKPCEGRELHATIQMALARHEDEMTIQRSEERLRQSSVVFRTCAEAIAITDAERRIAAVNPAFSRITGFAEDEVRGLDLDLLLRVSSGPGHRLADFVPGEGDHWHGEVRCYRKTGEAFPAWRSVGAVRDGEGALTHFVTAFSDVTAIYEAQRQLHHLAHHDALTGLPNRLLFDDRLRNAIEQGMRSGQRCLLLFLDLDGFKVINDTLGHVAGDELLRIIGARLKGVLRASDTVARLGGDEFVILAGTANPEYAAQLARKVLEQLCLPIPLSGQMLSITASLGIAVFPDHGGDSEQLMRAADMAMYSAKAEGRNRFHFYAEGMLEQSGERLHIEQGLRRAVANGDLAVHYQPRVDLRDGTIVGAEALVRWPHPIRGMVSPAAFIAIAEESGVIEQLGEWVLRRACGEMLALERWMREAGGQFHLSVNVSARQFVGSDFLAIVRDVIEETGFPAAALEIEITESTLQGTARSLTILNSLAAMGITASIDDFGTGYSSLSVLRDLPVHRVKIDRSFIVDLPSSEHQQAMVRAIVALSRVLRMAITVEGIESHEQAELLRRLGCHEGQGYYFGLPVAADELFRLLGAPRDDR